MRITQTLHAEDRAKWRVWLEKHHETAPEIWLIYHKKGTGKPRISYNDAVEEALCFGWIDSNVKSIDGERYAQRFSPRKSRGYSQSNIERLRRLADEGNVIPSVLIRLKEEEWFEQEFKAANDIINAIRADKMAWKNFQDFPEAYKRIRIGFIEGARDRPAEFKKRLNHLIKMSRSNRLFGFGGIEAYYTDGEAASKKI